MCRFSVIIPLYNKEKDIKKTLQSVLNQTVTDFEIIIVDDGSTDQSAAIVKNIPDNRIRLFIKKNEGVSKARNFGVQKAKSDFIAFLDADDYWYNHHLEDLNTLLTTFPETNWFLTAYEKKRTHNLTTKMVAPVATKPPGWMGIVTDYFYNSLVDCLAWTSAVCMKRDFFNRLSGFDTSITHGAGEDTDLWLRAALTSPPAFINTVSATHNLLGSNRISHTPTLKRTYLNLDKYEDDATKNNALKKYLDLNRYSLAIQHKRAGDTNAFKNYTHKIDLKNLSRKQRFLLRLPKPLLTVLIHIQGFLEKRGIRLRSF